MSNVRSKGHLRCLSSTAQLYKVLIPSSTAQLYRVLIPSQGVSHPAAKCRSEWHTPQNFISIKMSFGPTARRCIAAGLKSHDGPEHAMHRTSVSRPSASPPGPPCARCKISRSLRVRCKISRCLLITGGVPGGPLACVCGVGRRDIIQSWSSCADLDGSTEQILLRGDTGLLPAQHAGCDASASAAALAVRGALLGTATAEGFQ